MFWISRVSFYLEMIQIKIKEFARYLIWIYMINKKEILVIVDQIFNGWNSHFLAH
jgi:hypothetical protein